MTTIAFDSSDPAAHVRLLRQVAKTAIAGRGAGMLVRLAAAIEAAADKRVVVFDIDELGFTNDILSASVALRDGVDVAESHGYLTIAAVGRAAADALDSLTPPRPPEPKPEATGAAVRDGEGERWVWNSAGAEGAFWRRVGVPERWARWSEIPGPITVLSPGADGAS